MNMRICLLLLFAGLASFSSVAQKKKMEPIEYNDRLAAITDTLYSLGMEWGTEFQQISASDKDYSKLGAYRKKIYDFADRKIAEVRKEAPVGKGGEVLKTAMLDFLAFEKNMVNNAFLPIEKMNAGSSQEAWDAALKKLTDDAETEGKILKKVNEAQEAFAQQNGFVIEETTEE